MFNLLLWAGVCMSMLTHTRTDAPVDVIRTEDQRSNIIVVSDLVRFIMMMVLLLLLLLSLLLFYRFGVIILLFNLCCGLTINILYVLNS